MVFSAASLTDVMNEIAGAFEKKHGGRVHTNIASSGTLARQITQGMLPDVYISASRRWMDFVDSLGYMKSGTVKEIAGNTLVLIAPSAVCGGPVAIDRSLDLIAMTDGGRLSIGDPAHVPAGKYAKEALMYFGWESVLEKHVLPAKDVRSALMLVEMGEVPLGIVYRTDALKSRKVKVIGTFPLEAHTPIVYMAGVCSENDMAGLFMSFLISDASREIWRKFGFTR
jgi:molybdate transport system substrate-binding protein